MAELPTDHNISTTSSVSTSSNLPLPYLLQHYIGKLYNDATFSDIKVIGQEHKEIHLHRAILSSYSKVFKAMFLHNMVEKLIGEIIIDDVEFEPLEMMFRFMYEGETVLSSKWILHILTLANRYDIVPLQDICLTFISKNLTVNNCCTFLLAADELSLISFYPICLSFIANNFEKVIESEGFLSLPSHCLQSIIQYNDLVVSKETIVYESVTKWLDINPKRQQYLAQLAPFIRFYLIPPDYLHNIVEKNENFMKYHDIKDLLLNAYRIHALDHQVSIDKNFSKIEEKYPERNRELNIFGPSNGKFYQCTDSRSVKNYPLDSIRYLNEKYWLPINDDQAYIGIVFDQVYYITSISFQNRHSLYYSIDYKIAEDDEWTIFIPSSNSGDHKTIHHLVFSRFKQTGALRRPLCRYLRICISGKRHQSVSSSVYWIQIQGRIGTIQ